MEHFVYRQTKQSRKNYSSVLFEFDLCSSAARVAARVAAVVVISAQEITVTAAAKYQYDYNKHPNPAAVTVSAAITSKQSHKTNSSFQLYTIHYAETKNLCLIIFSFPKKQMYRHLSQSNTVRAVRKVR